MRGAQCALGDDRLGAVGRDVGELRVPVRVGRRSMRRRGAARAARPASAAVERGVRKVSPCGPSSRWSVGRYGRRRDRAVAVEGQAEAGGRVGDVLRGRPAPAGAPGASAPAPSSQSLERRARRRPAIGVDVLVAPLDVVLDRRALRVVRPCRCLCRNSKARADDVVCARAVRQRRERRARSPCACTGRCRGASRPRGAARARRYISGAPRSRPSRQPPMTAPAPRSRSAL